MKGKAFAGGSRVYADVLQKSLEKEIFKDADFTWHALRDVSTYYLRQVSYSTGKPYTGINCFLLSGPGVYITLDRVYKKGGYVYATPQEYSYVFFANSKTGKRDFHVVVEIGRTDLESPYEINYKNEPKYDEAEKFIEKFIKKHSLKTEYKDREKDFYKFYDGDKTLYVPPKEDCVYRDACIQDWFYSIADFISRIYGFNIPATLDRRSANLETRTLEIATAFLMGVFDIPYTPRVSMYGQEYTEKLGGLSVSFFTAAQNAQKIVYEFLETKDLKARIEKTNTGKKKSRREKRNIA